MYLQPYFESDASNTSWGFKLYAIPCNDASEEVKDGDENVACISVSQYFHTASILF